MKILKENFKSLEDKKTKKIDGALLYAQCKRAMLEMNEILQKDYQNSTVVSVHPG
jgi:hypothetical protein